MVLLASLLEVQPKSMRRKTALETPKRFRVPAIWGYRSRALKVPGSEAVAADGCVVIVGVTSEILNSRGWRAGRCASPSPRVILASQAAHALAGIF